jgi:hypothetical protein
VGDKVYFISDGRYTKIGISANVRRRLRTLQTSNPKPLRVVATLSGGSTLEKQLHERFKTRRIQGEWFDLSHEDIQLAAGLMPPEPVRDTEPERDLEPKTISTLAGLYPAKPLEIEVHGNVCTYAEPVEECERAVVVETEAGVKKTLRALYAAESLQEQYEILLLAAILDIQWNDSRTGYLDGVREELAERHFSRVYSQHPDLVEGRSGLDLFMGARRRRRYLPFVTPKQILVDSGEAWYSPNICLKIMREAFQELSKRRIFVPAAV